MNGKARSGTRAEHDGIRLSVVVMTHRDRLPLAERLAGACPELGMRIVLDPRPDGPPGSFRTARAAWSAVLPAATHHLVLQDDVELCRGFSSALHSVISARPRDAISLFTEWGSRTSHGLRIAALTGRAWAQVTDTYVPSQGLVLPAGVARSADAHLARAEAEGEPDDMALLTYLDRAGIECHACVPNLLEHQDVPSLVGNNEMGVRSSVCYFADGPDAAELSLFAQGDSMSDIDFIPYFSWTEGSAHFCVRAPEGAAEWHRVPALRVFAARGVHRDRLAEAFGETMAGLEAEELLRERISPILLHQLWLTGVAHGLRIAELTGTTTISPNSRAARRAVGTMGAGALRRFVPPQHMPGLEQALDALTRHALQFGGALTSSCGPAPGYSSIAHGIGSIGSSPIPAN
ncbi:hypothetical protein E1292_31620 [Nonomuraea deserti]|uniref:Uncharacterized protein n=1 Tax=Nonomuraea deserti TaxID=1848322 RepID=A0A4R4VC47_9ACTN|nr:hypothetical protein [Nonomuraea deserti]TDC99483.1 hypothetical protein E1292_31620 [Nonomuraea deserti]